MRKTLFVSTVAGVLALGAAGAATISDGVAQGSWADASVDGWSGVTVLDSANATIAAADSGGQPAFNVTSASFWMASRANVGDYNVVPIIVDPSGSIVWVGSTLTPTAVGLNIFDIDSGAIAHGGLDHRIGFYQWQNGVDDVNGGAVAFGAAGGEGMFQMNVDGATGAGAVTAGMTLVAGHSNGARDYHYENEVSFGAIPEPGAVGFIGLTGLAILFRRRRK